MAIALGILLFILIATKPNGIIPVLRKNYRAYLMLNCRNFLILLTTLILAGCGDGLTDEERAEAEAQRAELLRSEGISRRNIIRETKPIDVMEEDISYALHYSVKNEIQKARMIEKIEGQVVQILVKIGAKEISIIDDSIGKYKVIGNAMTPGRTVYVDFQVELYAENEEQRNFIENADWPDDLVFKGRVSKFEDSMSSRGGVHVEDAIIISMQDR